MFSGWAHLGKHRGLDFRPTFSPLSSISLSPHSRPRLSPFVMFAGRQLAGCSIIGGCCLVQRPLRPEIRIIQHLTKTDSLIKHQSSLVLELPGWPCGNVAMAYFNCPEKNTILPLLWSHSSSNSPIALFFSMSLSLLLQVLCIIDSFMLHDPRFFCGKGHSLSDRNIQLAHLKT